MLQRRKRKQMIHGVNFIAIDFETATRSHASICEAGICVVRDGEVTETRSWLVQPQDNWYDYWNIRIHGITPQDTECSPDFPAVWAEIEKYLDDSPVLIAHNAAFDISCIRQSLECYGLPKPAVSYYCSLRAARRIYRYPCNKLDYLCQVFEIPCECHHRAGADAEMCARLFLREMQDAGAMRLSDMSGCDGVL
jgi:hypothetical protein